MILVYKQVEGIKQQEGMHKTLSKKAFYKLIPQRPSLEANLNQFQQHASLFFVCLYVPSFTSKPKSMHNLLWQKKGIISFSYLSSQVIIMWLCLN